MTAGGAGSSQMLPPAGLKSNVIDNEWYHVAFFDKNFW